MKKLEKYQIIPIYQLSADSILYVFLPINQPSHCLTSSSSGALWSMTMMPQQPPFPSDASTSPFSKRRPNNPLFPAIPQQLPFCKVHMSNAQHVSSLCRGILFALLCQLGFYVTARNINSPTAKKCFVSCRLLSHPWDPCVSTKWGAEKVFAQNPERKFAKLACWQQVSKKAELKHNEPNTITANNSFLKK